MRRVSTNLISAVLLLGLLSGSALADFKDGLVGYWSFVQPNWIAGCNSSRAQSPHPAGIQVCLGDASVRFVNRTISPDTWGQACDPRDGNPLGSDW